MWPSFPYYIPKHHNVSSTTEAYEAAQWQFEKEQNNLLSSQWEFDATHSCGLHPAS